MGSAIVSQVLPFLRQKLVHKGVGSMGDFTKWVVFIKFIGKKIVIDLLGPS